MDKYKEKLNKCQGDSEKILSLELSDKFGEKKKYNELLSSSYMRLSTDRVTGEISDKDFRKWKRVNDCACFLEFGKYIDSNEKWKLQKANFCRDRLCPVCGWRRSLKIFSHVSQIMNVIQNEYQFLFLTLTVPNCKPEELNDTITALMSGFNRFIQYKRIKTAVKGFFRCLEITRNMDYWTVKYYKDKDGKKKKKLVFDENGNKIPNPFYKTYHPHFHIILAVPKDYTTHYYIKQDEWLNLWRKAMKDDTITSVDIRTCKSSQELSVGAECVQELTEYNNILLGKAVAEVAKYTVKGSDFLFKDDNKLTDENVSVYSKALYHRRLTAFGGVFDDVLKKLQLDDCEDGDLIHVSGENIRSDVGYMIRRFSWSCGAYKMIDNIVIEPAIDEGVQLTF